MRKDMLTYDDLAGGLEDAWVAAQLHEHSLIEAVVPDIHDRTFRAELFPEHPEPLTDMSMPPWVELAFTWTAAHQLRSEGRTGIGNEPLELTWIYNVPVHGMTDRNDNEFVRMFQRAVQTAYARVVGESGLDMPEVAVEVRRMYLTADRHAIPAFIQLVSSNVTDLSELWQGVDAVALRETLGAEMQFAAAVINALAEVFAPGGRGGYRSVDTA
jgi:hypothetical protein